MLSCRHQGHQISQHGMVQQSIKETLKESEERLEGLTGEASEHVGLGWKEKDQEQAGGRGFAAARLGGLRVPSE